MLSLQLLSGWLVCEEMLSLTSGTRCPPMKDIMEAPT